MNDQGKSKMIDHRGYKSKRDLRAIDAAWDLFAEYIGTYKTNVPLTVEQFDEILAQVDENDKLISMRDTILQSFQYDSYMWPLVERISVEDKRK